MANFKVFPDDWNDAPDKARNNLDDFTVEEIKAGIAWRTSRSHSEEPTPGYWHWPPRVG